MCRKYDVWAAEKRPISGRFVHFIAGNSPLLTQVCGQCGAGACGETSARADDPEGDNNEGRRNGRS